MSKSNVDRNLLVGILALQLDFIDREQLVDAMQAWILDKSKTLLETFVEMRALSMETSALLEALVQKHLELHEDDPSKSLMSLSSIGSVRTAIESLGDEQIAASIANVSAALSDEDKVLG